MVGPRRSKVHYPAHMGINSKWTTPFRRSVFSQAGQDGVIERIFELMPPKNKWCVEFGAYNGVTYSNTWSLLNEKGWSGVLIEGNSERAAELKKFYEARDDVKCINRFVGFTPGTDTLDDMLAEAGCPENPDFMSIDIDGNDWHIWESLKNFRPRLVIIEYNPTAPNDMYFVQDKDFSVNQSNSLSALIELGKEKGYELVACDYDAYFVEKESFGLFNIENNEIEWMNQYAPSFFFFQGFDGSMILAGDAMLNWQGIKITEDDIQVLPKDARKVWWTE